MSDLFLCYIKDIPVDGCKGFTLSDDLSSDLSNTLPDNLPNKKDNNRQDIFIVNRNGNYFGYKNSCPHTGANLNWQPDIFMDYDNFYIQCSLHAARFEVESGYCVWGPCVNQSLQKRKLKIDGKKIYLVSE
ncbi:MAG: Rieske 2Fe-2S domain-containing protein [Gammaproteobacteria bacterium]|nr:Rieske 2Fe-2S domain-containing protein [Gammaproteobacteria bacterium]